MVGTGSSPAAHSRALDASCREKHDGRSQGEDGGAEAGEVAEVRPQGLHGGDEVRGLYDQNRRGGKVESGCRKERLAATPLAGEETWELGRRAYEDGGHPGEGREKGREGRTEGDRMVLGTAATAPEYVCGAGAATPWADSDTPPPLRMEDVST